MDNDSEVYNEFYKLALEKGIIEVTADDIDDGKKKPARNKSTDEAVQLLYGVNPETIFDEDDMDGLLDAAHPETFVAGRAYDAMNAVVENLHQRHDIMTYIAKKNPSGNLTGHRYVKAKEELMQSLIKAAFLCDNKNETQLMSLADYCAERLEKKSSEIVKTAIFDPVSLSIIGGVIIIAGVLYFAYGDTLVKNVQENSKKVLNALRGLEKEAYHQELLDSVTQLEATAKRFWQYRNTLSGTNARVKDVKNFARTLSPQEQKAMSDYREALKDSKTKIEKAIQDIEANLLDDMGTKPQDNSEWYDKLMGVGRQISWSAEGTLLNRLNGSGSSWRKWYRQNVMGTFYSDPEGGLIGAINKETAEMEKRIQEANTPAGKQKAERIIAKNAPSPMGQPNQPEQQPPPPEQTNQPIPLPPV